MNLVDYILIAIVGLSVILSLWRGFVREIISIIGLIAAFLIASRASGLAGDIFAQWMTKGIVTDIAGFVVVFVLVMVVVGLVGTIIRKLVDIADLTTTDRTLGMFFGLARGVLLISLVLLIYTSYVEDDEAWMEDSLLTPYALEMSELLGKAIPEGYAFSRQGLTIKLPSPQDVIDRIPIKDKEELKSFFQDQMK